MVQKSFMTGALAVAVLSGSFAVMDADAATYRYRQSGNWTQISDGSSPGWALNDGTGNSGLPDADDTARINFGNNTVIVNTSVDPVGRVQIGVDESGTVKVEATQQSSGVLTASTASGDGDILVGNNNSNATGTLIVNGGGTVNVGRILWMANENSTGILDLNVGGTINVASHLWWGTTGTATASIEGTLNQTGGILGLGTNDASTATGGTAQVTIEDGGLFALNNIASNLGSIQNGSSITILDTGELTLPGDFIGTLQNYVNAGKIIGANLTIDMEKNPGFTTVYNAVPEPASLMVLGIGALALSARRRRH